MDPEIFETWIALSDASIMLMTAADVVQFSFIVQNSISHLDLTLSSSGSRLFRNFLSTEEACRKFCTLNRRLLYTLHLDLPRGRECSLKDEGPGSPFQPQYFRGPHIHKIILAFLFYPRVLSDFVAIALSRDIPKLKILKCIVKFDFGGEPLLSRLDIRTASKFIDCFYPEVKAPEYFECFIRYFNIMKWIEISERPNMLEYLLYHTRRFGNARLEREGFHKDPVDCCINNRLYLNIGPLLKLRCRPFTTQGNYIDYISKISLERPRLTNRLLQEAEGQIPRKRIFFMLQIIVVYLDTHLLGSPEAASEALRLIWSSVPDECITLRELKTVFGEVLGEQELTDVYDFYARAIDESHDYLEPRSLQHLCRTVLRGTLAKNQLWIPEGIRRTGLPELIQSFLNLEQIFVGF